MTTNNPFKYSDTNKRYQSADYAYRLKYGTKVFKIGIDAGFSCPNRDGKVATGGCYFCPGELFPTNLSPLDQFYKMKQHYKQNYKDAKFIVYFQSYSSTYASVEYLSQLYNQFIYLDDVVGINIATRPDCIDDHILNYLSELNLVLPVEIELGLQTIFDSTASNFNRGYDYEQFLSTYTKLKQVGIKVVVHVIFGLPEES